MSRRRILVVAGSSGRHGGGPVLNFELTRTMARHHDVTLLTVEPAENHGDARVIALPIPDGKSTFTVLDEFGKSCTRADLGLDRNGGSYDLILGHDWATGHVAANIEERFPGSRIGIFIHATPARAFEVHGLGEVGNEWTALSRAVLKRADLGIGVGPLLTAEIQWWAQQDGLANLSTHEFTPAPTPVAGSRLPLPESGQGPLKLLLMGRLDDPLKGMDVAVEAVLRARSHGQDVRLVLRGISEEAMSAAQRAVNRRAGGAGIIDFLPFTSDEQALQHDIQSCHALLMPSVHEGLGLVAGEAAAAAKPILVNRESGFGWFLTDPRRPWSESAPLCVVNDLGHLPSRHRRWDHPPATTSRAEQWAEAIVDLAQNGQRRAELAARLAEHLRDHDYEYAAKALVTAAMAIDPAAQRSRDQAPRHTIQGGRGEVIPIALKPSRDPGTPPAPEGRRTDSPRGPLSRGDRHIGATVAPAFPVWTDYPGRSATSWEPGAPGPPGIGLGSPSSGPER